MIIHFSPIRDDNPVKIERSGNSLIINGVSHVISEDNDDLAGTSGIGDVQFNDDDVEITVMLPHGPNPKYHQAFPGSEVVNEDRVIIDQPTAIEQEIAAFAGSIVDDNVAVALAQIRAMYPTNLMLPSIVKQLLPALLKEMKQ